MRNGTGYSGHGTGAKSPMGQETSPCPIGDFAPVPWPEYPVPFLIVDVPEEAYGEEQSEAYRGADTGETPANPAHVCLLRAWNELLMQYPHRLSTIVTDDAGPIMTVHSYRKDVLLAQAMTAARGPPNEREGLLRTLAKEEHSKQSIEAGLQGASSRMRTEGALTTDEEHAIFTTNDSSSSITGATGAVVTVGVPKSTSFTKAPQRVLVHNSRARQFTAVFTDKRKASKGDLRSAAFYRTITQLGYVTGGPEAYREAGPCPSGRQSFLTCTNEDRDCHPIMAWAQRYAKILWRGYRQSFPVDTDMQAAAARERKHAERADMLAKQQLATIKVHDSEKGAPGTTAQRPQEMEPRRAVRIDDAAPQAPPAAGEDLPSTADGAVELEMELRPRPSRPDVVYEHWDVFQETGVPLSDRAAKGKELLACIDPEHSWAEVCIDKIAHIGTCYQEIAPGFLPAHFVACLVYDALKGFGCWRAHGRLWLERAIDVGQHSRPLPQASDVDAWFEALSTLEGLVRAFTVNRTAGRTQAEHSLCFVTTGRTEGRERPETGDVPKWPDQTRVAIPMPMAVDVVEWLRQHRTQQSLPDRVDMPPYGRRRARQAHGWQGVGPIHATTAVRAFKLVSLKDHIMRRVSVPGMPASRKDLAKGYLDPRVPIPRRDQLWPYSREGPPTQWQDGDTERLHRILSSPPAAEVSVLLTRAQVTAYRFDHIVPDPAARHGDKRESYMEAFDDRGEYAPSHYTEGPNRVHWYVSYHFQRPPTPTHTAWHARYLGALAVALPGWIRGREAELTMMAPLPEVPREPVALMVRSDTDLRWLARTGPPDTRGHRGGRAAASSSGP